MVKIISILRALCSTKMATTKYLSWILPMAAALILFSNPANAQTAISFSFTGTGTSSGGGFSLNGSGTITPYGATTIAVTGSGAGGGAVNLGFVVTFGDGSTWSATSTVASSTSTNVS